MLRLPLLLPNRPNTEKTSSVLPPPTPKKQVESVVVGGVLSFRTLQWPSHIHAPLACHQNRIADLQECSVDMVTQYRVDGAAKALPHEVLVFRISSGEDVRMARVERLLDGETDFDTNKAALLKSDVLNMPLGNGDQIIISAQHRLSNYAVVRTLTASNPCDVISFMALLESATLVAVDYKVRTRMCLWYAEKVFAAFTALTGTQSIEKGPGYDQAGKYLTFQMASSNSDPLGNVRLREVILGVAKKMRDDGTEEEVVKRFRDDTEALTSIGNCGNMSDVDEILGLRAALERRSRLILRLRTEAFCQEQSGPEVSDAIKQERNRWITVALENEDLSHRVAELEAQVEQLSFNATN